MKRFFFFLFLAVIIFFTFGADVNAADEEYENYSAVLYDSSNGLPASDANAIAQTDDGFIWIGSNSGLIRYDGNKFEYMWYDIGITGVECLYKDSKDRLWIGMSDNGIAVMENHIIRFMDEKLDYDIVRSIAEDGSGNIYFVFSQYIIMLDSKMEYHILEDETINEMYFNSAVSGSDGLVYVLSSDSDIFTMKDGKVTDFADHRESLLTEVTCILPDRENPGQVYFGMRTTVWHLNLRGDISDWELVGFSEFSINEMVYINGEIMMCTGNYAGFIDGENISLFEHLSMNSPINHVMRDYEGNLWFTSARMGVMKAVPNQFTDIYEKYGIANDAVNAVCKYDGKLFVGTDMGLTVADDKGPCSSVPIKTVIITEYGELEENDLLRLIGNSCINSIVCDSKNRLWITAWKDCIYCYEKDTVTVYNTIAGLVSDNIVGCLERKDGSMLVVMSDGFNIISDGKVLSDYKNNEFPNEHIVCATEGENGDIILGTSNSGLYIAEKNGGYTALDTYDGLSSRKIMRIKKDHKRDIYWIITGNSIAYITPDYKIKTVSSLPYHNNFDMYQNSRDEMWILGSTGILVVSTEDMMADQAENPIYYGMEDGLPYIPAANSYSELTKNGDLYVVGNRGVFKVNIENFSENTPPVKAAVPYIEADGTRIFPDDNGSFHISSDVKKLTVYGYVMNYSLTKMSVSYRLEGFDESYKTVDRREFATVDYTNLSGGEYNFVMQVKNTRGVVNQTVSVKIIKEKSYFEQIWFTVLVGLLILTLIGICTRLYMVVKMKRLEKKQRESMMLVHDITEAFAKVIDMKDKYTNGHSTRVAKYTVMLAKELDCDEETAEKYYYIALLHDIGKVGVPSEVLNKPGKLTDEEFDIIKSHTELGYEALKNIRIMPELALGAQAHHERPDGKGYPNHLKGDDIPRVAQIIAVADCFDAMYSNRPYRKRMNFDKAVSIIRECAGTQLSEDVVSAFLKLVEKGEFRDPEDDGGGTTENIENIRK